MSWRVAKSLEQLLLQVNTTNPGRSKVSDGAIGDAAHAASESDHNPDAAGVVHARDFTNDPTAPGLDSGALAEQLRHSQDPRIKYVISRRRIFAGNVGPSPWVWRTYTGSDPHTSHVHVSVLSTAAADSPTSWSLSSTGAKYPSHGHQVVRLGSHGDDVAYLQRFLGGLAIDGDFGKATLAAVNRYQRVNGLSVDGVVGPETWGHIATAVAAGHVTAYGH